MSRLPAIATRRMAGVLGLSALAPGIDGANDCAPSGAYRGGMPASKGPKPSATVRCAMTASRSFV